MTANGSTHPSPPPPGSYVPCLTFFKEDESLDMDAIKAHALRMAQGGLSGLVIHGSNGEAVHISAEERKQTLLEVRAHLCSNGYPNLSIIAGTGAPSLQETLRLTKDAKEAGADYAMVLPPSYWAAATKPHLIKFFTTLADQSPLPIVIYNFPAVSNGIDLDSSTLLTLAKHPNIVGCKLTCANIGKTHRVASGTNPKDFAVIAGKSEVFLHSLVAGASGVVAGLCNLCPKLHVELWNRYQAGDLKGAKELQDIFSDSDALLPGLGLGNLKLLVSQYFGYGNGVSRSPLPSGSKEAVKVAESLVDELVKREKAL